MKMRLMAAAVALALTSVAAAQAFAQDAPQETTVEADEMEIIDAENKTVFRGNVAAVRDKTRINSNELVVDNVEVKQADGSVKKEVGVMRAKGAVRIVTENNDIIVADWADIYDKEDRLEAGGNVTLTQGSNVVKGQKLTSNLKTKRTVVTGGRVKGNFIPK